MVAIPAKCWVISREVIDLKHRLSPAIINLEAVYLHDLRACENGKDVVVTTAAGAQSASTAALDKLGLSDAGGSSTAIGIGLSVTTVRSAENTIERIDDALEKISSIRGKLGAIQNRLSSTISNLANVSQNLSSAKSQIVDADFAAETSKMSKAQILQQAGTAMLAQANASTQNVLSLLQG